MFTRMPRLCSWGVCLSVRVVWSLFVVFCSVSLVLGQQKAFVDTPEQLQKAVEDEVHHIIIRQHLDMRELRPDPQSGAVGALLAIAVGTKSIRGDCASAAPLPDNIDLDPPVSSLGQCIVTVNSSAIELTTIQSQLLLSDVYLRLDRTAEQQRSLVPIISITEASFFTGFTASEAGAVLISEGARAGFKDCTLNLNSASGFGAVLDIRTDAGAWMQACTMSSITDAGTRLDSKSRGIAQGPGSKYFNDKDFHGAVDQSGALLDPLPLDSNAIVELGFLVGQAQEYEQIAEDQTRLTNLAKIPIEMLQADEDTGDTDDSNTTLIAVVCAVLAILTIAAISILLCMRRRSSAKKLRARKQAEETQKASESMMYGALSPGAVHAGRASFGGTPPRPVSVGAYSAYPPVSGSGCDNQSVNSNPNAEKDAAYVQYAHPGMHPNSQGQDPQLNVQNHGINRIGSSTGSGTQLGSQGRYPSDPNFMSLPQHGFENSTISIPGSMTRSSGGMNSAQQPSSGTTHQTQHPYSSLKGKTGTWMTDASLSTVVRPTNPGPGARISERKAFLDYQLDTLRGRQVLTRLVVLDGVNNRRHGGQAVVQIAEDSRTRMQYAMKFYLVSDAFRDEKALYLDPDQPLGKFLPEVRSIVEPGELKDGHSEPLPPCIVMEKGESLDVWAATSGDGLDMITGLQVLTHVADRLSDLHAAGYVHRDIKPGNIMWLPQKKRWTLIDFGCVARIGDQAPTGFSFMYAAPEVLGPHMAGARTTHVAEAIDAWAVGILAIEIFTGQPVFDIFQGSDKTLSMITGELKAPWEDEETAGSILKRCGHLKPAVLALLDRDPSKRPSMVELQRACKRIVSNTTITPESDVSSVTKSSGPNSNMSGVRNMTNTNNSVNTLSVPGSTVLSGVPYTQVHGTHAPETETLSILSHASQVASQQSAGPLQPGVFGSGSMPTQMAEPQAGQVQPNAHPVQGVALAAADVGLPVPPAPAPQAPAAAASAAAAAAAAPAPAATAAHSGPAAQVGGSGSPAAAPTGSERVMHVQAPLQVRKK